MFEDFGDAFACFCGREDGLIRGDTDDVFDFRADLFGFGGGEVDLVDHGHDFMVMLDRLIDIGERLRLHALRRVDHQQRAFARGEGAGDFVGEIDMAGRIHQVQLVKLAIAGRIVEPHGLRLDRNAALFLNVHIIKHLLRHLAFS